MKKFITLVTMLLCMSFLLSAQNVVLEQKPSKDTIEAKWGQNMKNFIHFYIRWDFMVGKNDVGANYKPGSSNFDFGMRYKLKLCKYDAIGMDFNFLSTSNYKLKQDNLSVMINQGDTGNFKKESLTFTSLGLEFFNRINYGRRGNAIGKFIDIGAFGNFSYYISHYIKDNGNSPTYGFYEMYERELKYTNRLNYGVSARLGFGRWVIDAHYRLSDLFKNGGGLTDLPELPKLQVGLEVGLF
ncbi:MAG: hypothetical protein NTW49_12005 [Bacteroidia bacterium]|nr:hypothetical protein [Bacteroidia bacterium]